MTWCTPEEASDIVGSAVSQNELNAAQSVLDIFSGITYTPTRNLLSRDLRMLKLALAYQAKWMADQIDVLNRSDVDNVNQDGMSFKNAHADAQLLAPLAKRALDKVSWRKARTIVPRLHRNRGVSAIAVEDTSWAWRSM
jgi:hypothetical protein